MRDLGVWNCALMGKLIWRLYEGNETLWIKWIHHYYLRNLDIWEWKPNRDASPMVKFLASSRDRIVEATGSLDMAKDFLQRAMGGARIQAKKILPFRYSLQPASFEMCSSTLGFYCLVFT